jgi:phosphopantetheinyl transferase
MAVKICLFDIGSMPDGETDSLCRSLEESERNRLEGIRNPLGKRQSLGALLALRVLMDGTLPSISRGSLGKPYFLEDRLPEFSLSHSHHLSAAALEDRQRGRIGMDLELLRPCPQAKGISTRFFDEEEREILKNASFDPAVFLALWTRKEARAKVGGSGLLDPPVASLYTKTFCLQKNGAEYLLSVSSESPVEDVSFTFCHEEYGYRELDQKYNFSKYT